MGSAINGILRALAAALGGYLVGQGLVDEKTASEIVGAITIIGTAVWSVYEKRKAQP